MQKNPTILQSTRTDNQKYKLPVNKLESVQHQPQMHIYVTDKYLLQ